MNSKSIIRIRLAAVFIALLAAACSPTKQPSQSTTGLQPTTATAEPEPTQTRVEQEWEQPEHRIAIRTTNGRAEFYDRVTGKTFVPRGVNYVFVPSQSGSMNNLLLREGVYDPTRTREDFAALAADGYNTGRVFLDQCNAGAGCIGDSDNVGLNPDYLANIADMTRAAKENGLYLLLTSNDLPDQGGYAEEANALEGETFAGYRNSYYLTPNAVNATRRYWRDLLTGLIEQKAAFDAVLGWQLLNEQWMFEDQPPLSLTSGVVETTTGSYDMSDPSQKAEMVSDGLVHYIAEVKQEILLHDPTALVTMGFFAPGAAPDWYVETTSLLERSDLDFFDFHGYPGDFTMEELASRFGMVGFEQKPIILGEYGPFRHIYSALIPAARAVTEWVSASCAVGFDGWLYWTYYPANPSVNDRTWGFTDEEGYFQQLLAPASHPDPCERIGIESPNLAYGQPAIASRSLAEEPANLAVDENNTTQWGAGADAPQWVEVDLEEPRRLTKIRLLVAQWPAGETWHQVQVLYSGGPGYITVHEFSGLTKDGDWLNFTPENPLEDVLKVRIRTVASPSWVAWKEVQVFSK